MLRLSRGHLVWELTAVALMGLGGAGVRSALSLLRGLLAEQPLRAQQVTVVAPAASQWWLDAAFQLTGAVILFAQGAVVLYLLTVLPPPGEVPFVQRLAAQLRSPRAWWAGVGIAALVGIPGIGLYTAAFHLGVARTIIPSTVGTSALDVGLLLLHALANGVTEELVMVWLLTRLGQLGWSPAAALGGAAMLRGSYHLYQGLGGGVGNVLMGLVFGWLYRRYGAIWSLIVAHWVMDCVVFLGYPLVAPLVGLPAAA